MKPFACSHIKWLQVLMIRTAAKILFFSNMQAFLEKNAIFYLIGFYPTKEEKA
jgi:hypothetical protein